MKKFMNQSEFEFGPQGPQGGRGRHHAHRGGRHPQAAGDAGHPGHGHGRPDDQGFGPGEGRGRGAGRGRGRGEGPGRGFGPGFGGPGFAGPGFGGPEGPMGGFGMPMPEGRGPRGGRGGGRRGPGRGRKGDVRNAVLALLAETPLNGYGLINAIAEKSNGLWRPSAGSIYPALGLLEDEGLIEPTEADGKKVFRLTEAGRTHVANHAEELASPWDKVAEPHRGFLDVRGDMHQLGMAVQQVVVTGDAEQVEAARKILERARKDVYRLLAGDAEA
ncbi:MULTISPECIES: PadR family transcriptional regulator [unclassified Luteococcus]|uniref:PadR family transcriptional regulator n=1 Tax=unclassified Luteococcus TaxID=2639923 RepID=UPI00313E59D4